MDIIRRKPITWIGSSRKDLKDFSELARQHAGRQLARVQKGLEPADWKPMPSVGIGALEIRVFAEGAYRVIYVAKFPEAVYVLHAFTKKTQKTTPADIRLARDRYRIMLNERKNR
jgi:phage-related protein